MMPSTGSQRQGLVDDALHRDEAAGLVPPGSAWSRAGLACVTALTTFWIVQGQFRAPRLCVMALARPVVPEEKAECSAWFYRNVKRDLWLATGSGGTDTCCGLVGGTPTLPVYAGEIQACHLGVAACAFNAHGQPVTDEVGELVVAEPMPSMPVRFWRRRRPPLPRLLLHRIPRPVAAG